MSTGNRTPIKSYRGSPFDPNAPDNVAQTAAQNIMAQAASNWIAALVSLVALVFSAFSLWETALKQADLSFYVSPVVHYTREGDQAEIFAVPITISNSGARDGAVLLLDLNVKTGTGGNEKLFYSAYEVDGSYFLPPGRYNQSSRSFERVDRPKTPFATIIVPGRGTYSRTILFYNKGKAWPKLVSEQGILTLTLRPLIQTDNSLGMIDRLFAKKVEPVTLSVRLPWFSDSQAKRGQAFRLVDATWTEEKTKSTDDDSKIAAPK